MPFYGCTAQGVLGTQLHTLCPQVVTGSLCPAWKAESCPSRLAPPCRPDVASRLKPCYRCHLVYIVTLEPVSLNLVFSLGRLFIYLFFKCIPLPSSLYTLVPSTKNERRGVFSCGWFRRCERPDVLVNLSTFCLHAFHLPAQLGAWSSFPSLDGWARGVGAPGAGLGDCVHTGPWSSLESWASPGSGSGHQLTSGGALGRWKDRIFFFRGRAHTGTDWTLQCGRSCGQHVM